MFIVIGMVAVIVAVLGGYLMEHGKLALLNQPAEFVIIFGAAMGS
jgi:chemotaxis protein MotA